MNIFPMIRLFLMSLLLVGSCVDETSNKAPESPKAHPDYIFDIAGVTLKCRDPFIFYDEQTELYYLQVNGGGKIVCYISEDLRWWRNHCVSFTPDKDFWGKADFWAPDMFFYRDKYYILATFSAPGKKRGTSFLVSDKPEGPYAPLVNGPITPSDQMCLDATLYIDENGDPWLIYCHEWVEAIDGEVCAAPLTEDLKALKEEPTLLFKASQATWVGNTTSGDITGKVTDAPFIFQGNDGKLMMIWSSFRADNGRYAVGMAYSEGGVKGPWTQSSSPVVTGGGHAMLFDTKEGRMMISYHSPNTSPSYLTLKKAYIYEDSLIVE